MADVIREVNLQDADYVLNLNEVNVEVLSPMDEDKFMYFKDMSELFQVAEVDGKPAAFLIALREGLDDYTSENYIWFSKQYDRFLYVDRIVIDESFRGHSLGRKLYEGVFDHAKATGVPVVTAEIDIIPYNKPSLMFHEAMGFEEVGQQIIRGGEIKVSLQTRTITDETLCPCCGRFHFEEKGAYEICPICGWEDDPVQRRDPDFEGGANSMSLSEARRKYNEEF